MGAEEDRRRMVLVQARATRNSIALVGDGQFMFEEEAVGVWKPANVPKPPNLDFFLTGAAAHL
jgi:hypothetical protein